MQVECNANLFAIAEAKLNLHEHSKYKKGMTCWCACHPHVEVCGYYRNTIIYQLPTRM